MVEPALRLILAFDFEKVAAVPGVKIRSETQQSEESQHHSTKRHERQ